MAQIRDKILDYGAMVKSVDPNAIGNYMVTYSATDPSGHAATQVTRNVFVLDTQPPVITLNGPSIVTVDAGALLVVVVRARSRVAMSATGRAAAARASRSIILLKLKALRAI